MKHENTRFEEIEEFFRTMQEKTEKYQKYFDALVRLPQEPIQKRGYSEYRTSSAPQEEIENA